MDSYGKSYKYKTKIVGNAPERPYNLLKITKIFVWNSDFKM